jgi:hypothetical protein
MDTSIRPPESKIYTRPSIDYFSSLKNFTIHFQVLPGKVTDERIQAVQFGNASLPGRSGDLSGGSMSRHRLHIRNVEIVFNRNASRDRRPLHGAAKITRLTRKLCFELSSLLRFRLRNRVRCT